uniref:CARD domain-containing protein n=1 Tax=Magallana gigas TaxID=29159 RepID=A0A8W8K3L4_MAGGI
MDLVQKGAILRTRVALVNDLDVSDELCDALMSQDIFSPLMIEYIMAQHTRMDKVRRLLDDLSRRGSNAYHGFLWALRNAGSSEDIPQQSKSEEPDFKPQPQDEVTVHEMASSSTISQDDDMIDLNLSTTSNQTGMDVDH